ncbi:lantibiotic dehydratase C-terminal domain-containing protein [Streptomyces bambusae]|uniref:lantibiotic dehydratase C-terminal domain-containing protein n=1 Tax=Streptomyces bambusae TaxID=1550616 RepID=UPI001CA56A0E|nr:lantibiotic dehydratase C-terminal domain-containing protein [Streptomyces bambusae]
MIAPKQPAPSAEAAPVPQEDTGTGHAPTGHAPTGHVPAGDGRAVDARTRDVVAYYHQPVKGPLLREALLPLADRCTAAGLTAHVERHWLHGPHLRLRIQGPPEPVPRAAAEPVTRAAEHAAEAVRDWVRAHPSTGGPDPDELLREAERAGRAELIAPPYGPIVADNTVRVEPVDLAPLRGLIGPDLTALRTELLHRGLPALHAGSGFLGARGDSAAARVEFAVTVLALHACAHPEGLPGGHYSYVSHLEDFLLHDDPDGTLRAGFEIRRRRTAGTVTALVRRIAEGRTTGWEQEWARWSAQAWRTAEERLRAGADLHGLPHVYRVRAAATGDPDAVVRWNQDIRTRYSEFHRLLRRSDPQGRMWSRPDYLVYRACTNALYQLLMICDVRSLERYLAAHLVVGAVPEVTGCDWRQVVEAAVAAVERPS